MFKIFSIIFISIAGLLPLTSSAALRVFACEPEWAALVSELAGNKVKLTTATKPAQDPHYIQARPSLISKIRRADLLVCSGAELETGWLPVLLRKGNNKRILTGAPGHLMISDYVALKEIPTRLDRSEGDVHAAGNPHFQTDPRNMLPAAKAITEHLIQLDADNAEAYNKLLAEFTERWKKSLLDWQQKALPLKGQPIVVYHRSWVYLEDWLGLKEITAIEPKPGIPPSSKDLADVLNRTRDVSGLIIIHAQYQSSKAIKWLANKTHAPITVIPSTVGGASAASDLFSWYDDILTRLLNAQETGNE